MAKLMRNIMRGLPGWDERKGVSMRRMRSVLARLALGAEAAVRGVRDIAELSEGGEDGRQAMSIEPEMTSVAHDRRRGSVSDGFTAGKPDAIQTWRMKR